MNQDNLNKLITNASTGDLVAKSDLYLHFSKDNKKVAFQYLEEIALSNDDDYQEMIKDACQLTGLNYITSGNWLNTNYKQAIFFLEKAMSLGHTDNEMLETIRGIVGEKKWEQLHK